MPMSRHKGLVQNQLPELMVHVLSFKDRVSSISEMAGHWCGVLMTVQQAFGVCLMVIGHLGLGDIWN